MKDIDTLLDDLAGDAAPVRHRSTRVGRLLLAAATVATLALVYLLFGFRSDVMAMEAGPLLGIAIGLMALLAIAAGASAIRMARPQVGASSSGAPWALAALMLLPLLSLVGIIAHPERVAGLGVEAGLQCLVFGLVAGLGTLALIVVWLRGGAPVAPERASWLAGLAAGAIGALAVTLECPLDGFEHLGVWHVVIPLVAAGATRVLLPRFIRW